MKTRLLWLALAAVTLLASSCTFQNLAAQAGHGRVIIAARGPQKAGGHPIATSPHRTRLAATPGARNISASTDIDAINYTVIDLSDGSVFDSGTIDLYYLSLELFLPPGGEFRIIVDVDITDTAPGTNVGVTHYGDQADFIVDDYYDTYVDLTVHPSQALVFDPATVTNATPSMISYVDPGAGTVAAREFYAAPLTASPSDKLFYGPDADLFYFNKTANSVYRWKDIASKMSASDRVLTGDSSFDQLYGEEARDTNVEIFAACADASSADTVWVVGRDTVDGLWYYYVADVSTGVPEVSRSQPITVDLEAGLTAPQVVPTGVAVDSTYRDVYITYRASNASGVRSGVLQYYGDELYASQPADQSFVDESSSIYTDVTWDQGKVWVTASPNTSLAGIGAGTGTATLLQFDDYLDALDFESAPQAYVGTLPGLAGATSLVLPNRFLGPVQGTSLFLGQWDFLGAGAHAVSVFDTDSTAVKTY